MKKMLMATILVSVLLLTTNSFAADMTADEVMAAIGDGSIMEKVDAIKAKVECLKGCKDGISGCGSLEKILEKVQCFVGGAQCLGACVK